MILKTTSYQVGTTFYATLPEAQQAEIATLLHAGPVPTNGISAHDHAASVIVANAERVLDILSTNSKSRPRARKINGSARKSRKPSTGTAALTPEATKVAGLL